MPTSVQGQKELPPRARRIQNGEVHHPKQPGTTSACAENTRGGRFRAIFSGNYLRVRGEYGWVTIESEPLMELPPRARRILEPGIQAQAHAGTTSACAENTSTSWAAAITRWNYLRVRGEYNPPLGQPHYQTELPPRARRILAVTKTRSGESGTTSACAENTGLTAPWCMTSWNYLRVRGEYNASAGTVTDNSELPPRARRIQTTTGIPNNTPGTTSACAENTEANSILPIYNRNYLRVRGEYPK